MITRSRSSKSRPSAPQPHRGPIEVIALILVLTAVPLAAQRTAPAQRGGVPRADTPQLLIGPFSSSDPALGLQAARIHPPKQSVIRIDGDIRILALERFGAQRRRA